MMVNDTRPVTRNFNFLDYQAIGNELKQIRTELDASRSEEDFNHLRKIEWWGRLCSATGFATAWIIPNPISAFLISQGNFTRWTMVTHHVTHRGYDKIPGIPPRYTSKRFARGWRRLVDWLDWIVPEAWDYEHNIFHHYYTGELTDPDLVERNVDFFSGVATPAPDQGAGDYLFHVHLEANLLRAKHNLDYATGSSSKTKRTVQAGQVALRRAG